MNGLYKAKQPLDRAMKLAKENNLSDLEAYCLTNKATLLSRFSHITEAVNLSRQAVEISATINLTSSHEHLEHIRGLIQIYIKTREYLKAEHLIKDHEFTKEGKIFLFLK
jgi:hypothetical protein